MKHILMIKAKGGAILKYAKKELVFYLKGKYYYFFHDKRQYELWLANDKYEKTEIVYETPWKSKMLRYLLKKL